MATSSTALRVGASIACAATLSLAACSDTMITPPARSVSDGGASLTQNPDILSANGPRFFHTKQWHDNDNAANGKGHGGGGGGGGIPSNGISYHGGPVLQAGTRVVAIYWASSPIYVGGPTPGTHGAGSADGSLVGYFLGHLGGSTYFNINSTYTDGSARPIVNSVTYTGYWANNANVPADGANVTDAQMLAMLSSGFTSGALTYDSQTLYAIFTAGTVNLGGGFGTQYCAYHWNGNVSTPSGSRNALYAAMPYDHAYPGACDVIGGSAANGSFDPGADAEVNTLGHETEETTTDPFGTAWFDSRGFENADKCAWTFGSTYTSSAGGVANMKIGTKDFLVQQNWVNANGGGCSTHWP